MKILLLEDDAMLGEIIKENLETLDYCVTWVEQGLHAETLALKEHFDLWLFDVNVPELNGFELLKGLRNTQDQTATIFITSLHDIESLKYGFLVGADDYLKKPFEMAELEVRIANIKKRLGLDQEFLSLGEGISFYPKTHVVVVDEQARHVLTQKESEILHFFALHPHVTHSHDTLMQTIWRHETLPTDNALRTYIKRLRHILGKEMIRTVHGQGYRLEI